MKQFLLAVVPVVGFLFQLGSTLECSNWAKPKFTGTYTPKGQAVVVAGMDAYEIGNFNASKIIIAVHDAGGLNGGTNIKQICDRLSEYGYRVVMPDFFHGLPWNWTEHDPASIGKYRHGNGREFSWENNTREDLGLVLQEYKRQGVTEFGIFGMCYGGKQAAKSVDTYSGDIMVAASFHPYAVDITDATRIRRPILLLPGADDPDMEDYCQVINILQGPGTCARNHIDVNHGYAGHMDWNNATIVSRAEDAVWMWERWLCEKFPI